MSILQFPKATEIVRLRSVVNDAVLAYQTKKQQFVAEMVQNYSDHENAISAKQWHDWMTTVVQDAVLEAEIWAHVKVRLTPDDFAGWYMLCINGKHSTAFQATDKQDLASRLRSLRRAARNKETVYTAVPLAEVLGIPA